MVCSEFLILERTLILTVLCKGNSDSPSWWVDEAIHGKKNTQRVPATILTCAGGELLAP